MAQTIKRGDIWVVDLEPGFGREIHKRRPGVVVSSDDFHKNSPHVVVVPGSSIVPNILTQDIVLLGRVKGLQRETALLPILIRSIDKERLVRKVGTISKEKLLEVEEALKLVLGMVSLD